MQEELIQNVKQFFNSAELVNQNNDPTSATMLYFKALFVLLDVALLRVCNKTPKDHTQRFKLLKQYLPEDYNLLDRYFTIYRSTYSTTISTETVKEIQNYVKQQIKKHLGN